MLPPLVLPTFPSRDVILSCPTTKQLDALRYRVLPDPNAAQSGYFFWDDQEQQLYQVPITPPVAQRSDDAAPSIELRVHSPSPERLDTASHISHDSADSGPPLPIAMHSHPTNRLQHRYSPHGWVIPISLDHTAAPHQYNVRMFFGGYVPVENRKGFHIRKGKQKAVPLDDSKLLPLTGSLRLGIDTGSIRSWIFASEIHQYPFSQSHTHTREDGYPLNQETAPKSRFADVGGPESFEIASADSALVGVVVGDRVSISMSDQMVPLGVGKFGVVNSTPSSWLDCDSCDGVLGLSNGSIPWCDSDTEHEETSMSLLSQIFLSAMGAIVSGIEDGQDHTDGSTSHPPVYVEIDLPISSPRSNSQLGGEMLIDVVPRCDLNDMIPSLQISGCSGHHPLLVLQRIEWGFTNERDVATTGIDINERCLLDIDNFNCMLPQSQLDQLFHALADSIGSSEENVVLRSNEGYDWLEGVSPPAWLRFIFGMDASDERTIHLDIPGSIFKAARNSLRQVNSQNYFSTPFISSGSGIQSPDGHVFQNGEVGGVIGALFLSWGKLCLQYDTGEEHTTLIGFQQYEHKYAPPPLSRPESWSYSPRISHPRSLRRESLSGAKAWHNLPITYRRHSDARNTMTSSPWYQKPVWTPIPQSNFGNVPQPTAYVPDDGVLSSSESTPIFPPAETIYRSPLPEPVPSSGANPHGLSRLMKSLSLRPSKAPTQEQGLVYNHGRPPIGRIPEETERRHHSHKRSKSRTPHLPPQDAYPYGDQQVQHSTKHRSRTEHRGRKSDRDDGKERHKKPKANPQVKQSKHSKSDRRSSTRAHPTQVAVPQAGFPYNPYQQPWLPYPSNANANPASYYNPYNPYNPASGAAPMYAPQQPGVPYIQPGAYNPR